MDHKDFRFRIKSVTDEGLFEGFAAVFGNKDLAGDIIEPGAFKKTLNDARAATAEGEPMFPFLWQHDQHNPVGAVTEAEETSRGLQVRGFVDLETAEGKRAFSAMRKKIAKGFSIGYDAVVWEWNDKDRVRILKEIKLWEVSLVTFPANQLAGVTSVKGATTYADLELADADAEWDGSAARGRVKAWASDGDEVDWNKYGKAFLWYDEDSADTVGAYKLPVADVIDGELKAVPKAVFAAASALMGGRGGVDIPAADVAKVKAHLARYYRKLEKPAPWEDEESAIELSLQTIIAQGTEVKAGRVLSTRNRALVADALEALKALLEAADARSASEDEDDKEAAPAAAAGDVAPPDGHAAVVTEAEVDALFTELKKLRETLRN